MKEEVTVGRGLNQKQRKECVKSREKETANQFGKDLLNFGLNGSTPVQYCAHQIMAPRTHQQKQQKYVLTKCFKEENLIRKLTQHR